VLAPFFFDLIASILNHGAKFSEFLGRKPVALGEGNFRLKPEFCFAFSRLDMDVHAAFFP